MHGYFIRRLSPALFIYGYRPTMVGKMKPEITRTSTHFTTKYGSVPKSDVLIRQYFIFSERQNDPKKPLLRLVINGEFV